MPSAVDLTKQGIAAAKARYLTRAAILFRQATQIDANYEMAWLWLSSVTDNATERKYSLERALEINPESKAAKVGLAKLGSLANDPLSLNQVAPNLVSPKPIMTAARGSSQSRIPFRVTRSKIVGIITLVLWCGVGWWFCNPFLNSLITGHSSIDAASQCSSNVREQIGARFVHVSVQQTTLIGDGHYQVELSGEPFNPNPGGGSIGFLRNYLCDVQYTRKDGWTVNSLTLKSGT